MLTGTVIKDWRLRTIAGVAVLGAALAACGPIGGGSGTGGVPVPTSIVPRAAVMVAGSTASSTAWQDWGVAYNTSGGVSVQNQPVGSVNGLTEFAKGVADIAATEVPISGQQLAQAQTTWGPQVDTIPVGAFGIAVTYNLPGISGLKLDGPTLSDIYQGNVKRWNDPEIAKQNPGVNLPNIAIVPVYRTDGSGTTAGFTQFLNLSAQSWRSSNVGTGAQVAFQLPNGIGAKESLGVIQAAGGTVGSIAYVTADDAHKARLSVAEVKDAQGQYVLPSANDVEAAARAAVRGTNSLTPSLSFQNAPDAYPISALTFATVAQAPKDPATGAAVRTFLRFALKHDQGLGGLPSVLAPLPAKLHAAALAVVNAITGTSKPAKTVAPTAKTLAEQCGIAQVVGNPTDVVPTLQSPSVDRVVAANYAQCLATDPALQQEAIKHTPPPLANLLLNAKPFAITPAQLQQSAQAAVKIAENCSTTIAAESKYGLNLLISAPARTSYLRDVALCVQADSKGNQILSLLAGSAAPLAQYSQFLHPGQPAATLGG